MIDYEKGIITGKSGKVYKISIENISAARYTEYTLRSSLLAFNTDFESIFTRINKSIDILRNGKQNAQGNASDVIVELEAILKGMFNYQDNTRPAIIEFVSTFVTLEGEDVSKHSEDQIREKYEDWAHIPMTDFFLLASKATPRFKEYLKSILESNKAQNQILQ
jgi:hypothetical protein